MEPDITRLHSCSPPPLDDGGGGGGGGDDDEDDGDVGLEEDDFGGFSVVVSCSPLSSPHSTEPIMKPAPLQPSYSFKHPVEQSQPVSIVTSGAHRGKIDVIGQSYITSLHLGNGYSKKEQDSVSHCSSSLEGASSPKEETGFADFTVFTDQAAHPWCCGFSPIGSTEQWGEKAQGVTLSKKICDPGQEAILDSEPGSHCALKGKGDVYTKFRHCEKIDPTHGEPSQDHHQPQGAAAAFDFQPAESHLWEENEGKPVDYWKESGHCVDEPEDYRKTREEIFSNVLQAFSMCDTASEDPGSFGDDFSFEGVSADLEPNVSSFTSHEDQTDWDKTDDEDEELGSYQFSDSVNNSLEQSEARNALNLCKQSTTQETPAASSLCGLQLRSVANTDGQFLDFGHCSLECQQDQAHADVRVEDSGRLPPSDSFADFCSAPTQEDGDGSWAEFKEQRTQEDSENCTQLIEKLGRLHVDEDSEEEQAGQCGSVQRNSCQASLLYRVQQLLLDIFPESVVTAIDNEELLSLDALLHTQHLPERGEEAELSSGQWMQRGLWWPQQDIHSAIGLQFQWKGSHTNRTLLSCLGVDTRNIVFVGVKKQQVTVPAFASGLQGLLEPTKDSLPANLSTQNPAVTTQTPPRPQVITDASTALVQEVLPSPQLGWSSRGLNSSQDDRSALNLDYFGTGEVNGSCRRVNQSNKPPPGLDPDLYELTIVKLEPDNNRCHLEDTLNRLMSSAVKTSTSIRKAQQDEELSFEACRVIDELPNLSFMKAKVLMFPSILGSRE